MIDSKEVVILNRDNWFGLFLMEQGAPVSEFGSITRVVIEIDGVEVDSDVVGSSVIWWSESEEWRAGVTKPVIKFKLGGQAIAAGTTHGCKVITFDAGHPNGIEWTRDLTIEVKP